MKKFKKVSVLFLTLILGILIGFRIFFPWNDVLELALLKGANIINSSGITLEVSDFENEGVFPDFVFKEVKISGLGGVFEVERLRVSPKISISLFYREPTFEIAVSEGNLALPGDGGKKLSGTFLCSLKPGMVDFSKVDITGDLSLSGEMDISLKDKKIIGADMILSAPAELDGAMMMVSKFLPFSKQGDGKWKFRREGGK